MNQDELKGKTTDLEGRVKESGGALTDEERLRQEGIADQAEDQAQEAWGRGKRKVGETIEDTGERMKK